MENLSYAEILKHYPLSNKENLQPEIASFLNKNRIKIVVIDDDPTGIQTVHGCYLITKCNVATLRMAFNDSCPFYYILTNSRSVEAADAQRLTEATVNLVLQVNDEFKYKIIFVSRSDSTLRGHFPLEPQIICRILTETGKTGHLPVFFIPSFLEVGRFTIDDVHYLKEHDNLIPVADTEFAKDNVFGYSHSNLNEYILEKTNNSVKKNEIGSLSLAELREHCDSALVQKISTVFDKKYVVVNALDYYDLRKFALAALSFVKQTSYLVLRTSSSLPKAISGIEDKPLLNQNDLNIKKGVGIFIVGSHVKKSTIQLEKLLEDSRTKGIELSMDDVLEHPSLLHENTIAKIKETVSSGITPVIYTSRKELRTDNIAERLKTGKIISTFIVKMVQTLPFKPSYIVAKGGITSNDILTDGLHIETARVAGQIITGVPVVVTNASHPLPEMPYIIFPGNVGEETSLLKVFRSLSGFV